MNGAAVEQQLLGQRRLAGVGVRDDGEGAPACDFAVQLGGHGRRAIAQLGATAEGRGTIVRRMRWPFALLPLLAACAPTPAPANCSLSFSDSGTARVFVVGHRVQLSDAASYDAYEASFRRHADAIRPCLSDQRPNLVVFPEESGLVAWFIGRQALAGRNAGDVGTAFQFIYAGAMRAADAYSERYPGISSARALTLAVSDVGWRAVDRTFGGLAKDLGAWVVTSADLPVSHPLDGRGRPRVPRPRRLAARVRRRRPRALQRRPASTAPTAAASRG